MSKRDLPFWAKCLIWGFAMLVVVSLGVGLVGLVLTALTGGHV